jgi:hypothetical protein
MRKPELTISDSKARAIADLDRARLGLVHHSARASDQLSPASILSRNLAKHRTAWIVGAAVLGVAAVRFTFSSRTPKNDRDNFQKSGRKAWLFRLIRGPLLAAGQKALLNYASTHLQNHFAQHSQPHPSEESQP